MGLWSNIKKVFVEEVEVTVDEKGQEIEDVVIHEDPAAVAPVTVEKTVEEVEPVKKPESFLNSVKIDFVEPEPVEEKTEKKSVFVNAVEPVVKKKEPVREETSKPAYEFTPVISPIFGMSEKDQKQVKVVKEIKKSPIHNSSALGTVISPIYGISTAQERANAETIHLSVDAPTQEEEEDITNISLEDLLGVENEPVVEDDFEIPFLDKIQSNNQKAQTEVEEIEEPVPGLNLEEVKLNEIQKVTEEEPVEEKTPEQRTNEIRKAMQQLKEEDLFEKEKQPTLFDF